MASTWDVASVVGPLVMSFVVMLVASLVSASPAATAFFHRITRQRLTTIVSRRGRCYALSWDDIPSGNIHCCHSGCQHVSAQAVELHGPAKCWDDSIGKVFNGLSSSANVHFPGVRGTVLKPLQLPLFQDFVWIDTRTLKAFLLPIIDVKRTCQHIDISSLLDIEDLGNVATVHLKSPPLAPGYPPFYRSFILTPRPGNHQIEHPTKGMDLVDRGAWVFAVALSINLGSIPSLYNMHQLRHKNDQIYWKGTFVMSSFEMIKDTLLQLRDFESSHRWPQQHGNFNSTDQWGDHA
jgi:hypothetical protein